MRPSRRSLFRLGLGAMGLSSPLLRTNLSLAMQERETHGLSTFGELALPPDFKHFNYVNPDAPKGGVLSVQIKQAIANQAFLTFDTLNIFVLKGNGAGGIEMLFDSLMSGSLDEPTSLYGLVARAVRYSADRLTYRFLLRPQARFHDGSPLTAEDVAFSLNILKEKGHPSYAMLLDKMTAARAESPDILKVELAADRSRDLHLVIAGMPIFSKAYWSTRDFEAPTLDHPLGSGAYQISRVDVGHSIEYKRVTDYWAKDLPVNVGLNNFDRIRYEYYRSRDTAFEDFKIGRINYNEEYTSRLWNTAYDFPAFSEAKVKKEIIPDGKPVATQGIYFNLRRPFFKDIRIRQAMGLLFDFEWINKNILYSSYKRLESLFQNSVMMATGEPGPEELALLSPFRGKIPDAVFGPAVMPPVSDGSSGQDRALLRQADGLLREAGCKREGNRLLLPDGKAFSFEYLDSSNAIQHVIDPFLANVRRLGIEASIRPVDSAQYQARLNDFDFDMITLAMSGTNTPGDDMRLTLGSQNANRPGSRNYIGVADPVLDALIEKIGHAETRAELDVAAKALDRVFRAGYYWIPMYYRDTAWVAYWDVFSRPQTMPKFSTGAPSTWWWDEEKAKRIGLTGQSL